MCADDVGSALRALKNLRTQHSIFKLAEGVANLVLKPSKCYIVISVLELTDHIVGSVRKWLADNIPEWKDFKIVAAGKYLGVYLGRAAAKLTYDTPKEKFWGRVNELADASAPSLSTVLRYNERVATVFSYVSQFYLPPEADKMNSLEHRAIHRILKLPPNSMSRKLSHSFQPFLPKTPTTIGAMVRATCARFARSEVTFLQSLKRDVLAFTDSSQSLFHEGLGLVPDGGLGCRSVLCTLLDATTCSGVFFVPPLSCRPGSGQEWVLSPTGSPPKGKSIQTALYGLYVLDFRCSNLTLEMSQKVKTTLGQTRSESFSYAPSWCDVLIRTLAPLKPHTAMCVFKTLIGGWTTSLRMHEPVKRRCIFGCNGEWDDLYHYLECPALWAISCGTLGCEVPIGFGQRLCMVDPSPERCWALALCFHIYHYTRHLTNLSPVDTQRAAAEAAKSFITHVK